MNLNDAFKNFMKEKQSSCAERTIEYYHTNISAFLVWLEQSMKCDCNELYPSVLNKDCFIDYITYLRKGKCKNMTVRTYFKAVKVFSKWLFDNNLLDHDYAADVKQPGKDAEIIIPLTNTEVDMMKQHIHSKRNLIIVMLMLDCGLRTQEVINLRIQDLNKNDLYIVVNNSKYNKSRMVPCPLYLFELMDDLIRENRSNGANGKYLFYDRYYRKQINYNVIKMIFRDLKEETGINRVHAHLLRHTFATSYIITIGNLELLRVILGHASYNITQNYLHISQQVLITKMDIYKIPNYNLQFY